MKTIITAKMDDKSGKWMTNAIECINGKYETEYIAKCTRKFLG